MHYKVLDTGKGQGAFAPLCMKYATPLDFDTLHVTVRASSTFPQQV